MKTQFNAIENMRNLSWNEYPSLVKIPTAGDGSCALHALVQAFHEPYQMGRYPDGNPVDRHEIVRAFRDELAVRLNKPIDGPGTPTWYDKLSRGGLEEYAKNTKNLNDFPDLSREGFEKHLKSSAWLGQEIIEYVSSLLGIGIIVIFSDHHGHYELNVIGKDADLIFEGRKRVVLMLNESNRHFSTIARREDDGSLRVFFDSSDEMIKKMIQSYT